MQYLTFVDRLDIWLTVYRADLLGFPLLDSRLKACAEFRGLPWKAPRSNLPNVIHPTDPNVYYNDSDISDDVTVKRPQTHRIDTDSGIS